MTAAKQLEFVSVADYLAGEQLSDVKHEYAGGYVYAMAGARTVHNRIATNWLLITGNHLRGQPCEPFNSDMKVRVQLPAHTRFYYPDGTVVCDANDPDDLYQDRPVIIAEVLSEATRRIDEGEKREAYLTIPTLAAYLLIETDSPRVVMHRRTNGGFVAECYDGLDAVVPMPGIDVELPLAELYERVEFKAE
ncbi:Uma2 family endonuclease [Aeoliella sp.]|uniref:Uma2 family endonuclease n=1 Tax=Aeoliella sp. TaxID=2795800 RepID=UPI003CCC0579